MKNFITGFFIAMIIGTAFGYFWAFKGLSRSFEMKLEQKTMIIDHYRNFWSPIREKRR